MELTIDQLEEAGFIFERRMGVLVMIIPEGCLLNPILQHTILTTLKKLL